MFNSPQDPCFHILAKPGSKKEQRFLVAHPCQDMFFDAIPVTQWKMYDQKWTKNLIIAAHCRLSELTHQQL
jgi:hypothetical protein